MVWPSGSAQIPTVTSEFDPARRNPVTGIVSAHEGIDLVGFDVVRAPFAGEIIMARYDGGYGNHVRIRRPNGDVIGLAHNRAFIRTSGQVAEGDPVAYMGSTGRSTGPHCHYETRPGGGSAINPRTYMSPTPNTKGSEDEMIWIAKHGDAYYLVIPQGGAKPKAVQLDGTGYQPTDPYAKIPQISFQEPWSRDAFWRAVDRA
jgi:hypothetical protein